MKVAPKLLLLFNDPAGVGAAIHAAIIPNPNSPLQRSEESFERSLEGYGIGGEKASGEVAHLVDGDGELVFVHVLNVPAVLLIGQIGQHLHNEAVRGELETLHELGELLASSLHLSFAKDRVKLNQGKTSKVAEEPWRALYG